MTESQPRAVVAWLPHLGSLAAFLQQDPLTRSHEALGCPEESRMVDSEHRAFLADLGLDTLLAEDEQAAFASYTTIQLVITRVHQWADSCRKVGTPIPDRALKALVVLLRVIWQRLAWHAVGFALDEHDADEPFPLAVPLEQLSHLDFPAETEGT
ncbi:hypothetical protein [Crossiella sp. CA198]|uniref:hypothetical protein n=1 Tax=Crossiella sp. CA198 TaxID=3455607 RepID=UPI003F8D6B59